MPLEKELLKRKDQDFNGTTGYDTLIFRLKDGKKFCDAFTEFLRNRAKIEDEYGRSLMRLAQTAVGNDEIGSLRTSWEAVKREAENVGKVHCEMAKKFNDLIDRALKFREQQKNERLKIDERMKKQQKDKKTAYDNLLKSKKTYEQRCKESDQCREAYESKSNYTPKEEDRLKKNLQKAKTSAENADSIYQSSVKLLEDCRKKWVLDMEDATSVFQACEEERIQFLRNEFWVYTNLGTLQAMEIDVKYEDCRKVIEKCNEKADIELFINSKHTGSVRPSPILYENYYHTAQNVPLSPTNSNSGSLSGSLGRNAMLPKPAVQKHLYTGPVPMNNKPQRVEDAYSTIADIRDPPPIHTKKHARAAFDYHSQGPQELTLRRGDIVEVIRIEDDSWAIGRLHGNTGAFPLEFVEEC